MGRCCSRCFVHEIHEKHENNFRAFCVFRGRKKRLLLQLWYSRSEYGVEIIAETVYGNSNCK